jgi:GAF domain-containing protein
MSLHESLLHPERLADLRETALLDTLPEDSFNRYIRLGRAFIDAPVLLISLVDADRQYFKGHHGLPEMVAASCQTPLSHSFCQHVVHSGDALVISDARRDPLVKDNPAVTDLGVIAYLGIPLRSRNRHVLGSFCVLDSKPRIWIDQDIRIMTDLADAISTEIQLRALTRPQDGL